MQFVINDEELAALSGLPHIQQLAYLRGIRPYMDNETGIVGIKRGISLQSIAEQLYVDPHQGISQSSYSRDQIRRALAGLVRAGVIAIRSEDRKLTVECILASRGYFVQNKAATNPPQEAATTTRRQPTEFISISKESTHKAATPTPPKAAIPLYKENNYVCLLSRFEQFWQAYPEKKSRKEAEDAFMRLQPDESLFARIMQALTTQIHHRDALIAAGQWQANWKYPANWLGKRCWEDELTKAVTQEKHHATRRTDTGSHSAQGWYQFTDDSEHDAPTGNVVNFGERKAHQQAH